MRACPTDVRRSSRLLPLALSAALLGLAPAGTIAAGAEAASGELPVRRVTIHGKEPKPNVFAIRGRVEGAWAERPVTVQRRNCRSGCGWFSWRTVRTDAEKRYAARVLAPSEPGVACYRVRVRATEQWAVSRSHAACVVTRSSSGD